MSTASFRPPASEADAASRPDDQPSREAGPATVDGLVEQQCGRCRKFFPGDPTLPRDTVAEWWACDSCRLALLGDRPRHPGGVSAPLSGAQ